MVNGNFRRHQAFPVGLGPGGIMEYREWVWKTIELTQQPDMVAPGCGVWLAHLEDILNELEQGGVTSICNVLYGSTCVPILSVKTVLLSP